MGYARLQMIKRFYGGIFIDKQKLSSEGIKHPIKVEYYKICDNTENKEIIHYGIEVVKTEYGENNINIENNEIRKITREEKIIDTILEKLKKNEVTPIATRYIIDDFMYNFQ